MKHFLLISLCACLTMAQLPQPGGSGGGAGGGTPNNSFACASSGNNAITHNANTKNIVTEVFDASDVVIAPSGYTVTATSNTVATFNFAGALSGRRCVVNASGATGPAGAAGANGADGATGPAGPVGGSYSVNITTPATTWTVLGTAHGLATADIDYWIRVDDGTNLVTLEGSYCQANKTTYDVTCSFATAQAGRLSLTKGGGGTGGGPHTHSADDITSGALAKARQHNQTAYADQQITYSSSSDQDMRSGVLRTPQGLFSAIPSASAYPGAEYVITDGNGSNCTAGGGSTYTKCKSNGTSWVLLGGSGGDTTTVANSGATGASVLKTSTNVTARKIKAGSNVTITENTDDIEIAASVTGSGNVPSGGTVGQTLRNSASGTASWTDLGRALEYISDGNGTRFRVTSAAAPMPLVNTVTWDPTSISAGARATQTVTVTGAQQGDPCVVGIPPGVKSVGSGLTAECAFETANTATIYLENNSASSRDPAPTTAWTVLAVKSTWAVE